MNPLSRADRDALERAVWLARRTPALAKAIDDRLARGDDWLEVATSAAYHCQLEALNCLPWQDPPMFGDTDRPTRDQHAAELLRRLLDAGLSRYEPNPIVALERAGAKKRVATPAR
jgi:hypothetical protein